MFPQFSNNMTDGRAQVLCQPITTSTNNETWQCGVPPPPPPSGSNHGSDKVGSTPPANRTACVVRLRHNLHLQIKICKRRSSRTCHMAEMSYSFGLIHAMPNSPTRHGTNNTKAWKQTTSSRTRFTVFKTAFFEKSAELEYNLCFKIASVFGKLTVSRVTTPSAISIAREASC